MIVWSPRFLFQVGGIRWIVMKCVTEIDVWCHTGHEQRSPEYKSYACLTQPSIPDVLPSLTFHSLYLASSFAAVIITTATRGRCFYLWFVILCFSYETGSDKNILLCNCGGAYLCQGPTVPIIQSSPIQYQINHSNLLHPGFYHDPL